MEGRKDKKMLYKTVLRKDGSRGKNMCKEHPEITLEA